MPQESDWSRKAAMFSDDVLQPFWDDERRLFSTDSLLCLRTTHLFAKLYFGSLQMITCRTFAKLFGDNIVTVQSVELHI